MERERETEIEMRVHEEEQREIVARRQESGSEERTTMWKRRKKRGMRRDGGRDTRGRSKSGKIMEVYRAALLGAENQIINQTRLKSESVSKICAMVQESGHSLDVSKGVTGVAFLYDKP